MSKQNCKPKWWRLYAIPPIGLALLAFEPGVVAPEWEHKLLQIAIVLVIFGLMIAWLMANAVALELTELDGETLPVATLNPVAGISRRNAPTPRNGQGDPNDTVRAHSHEQTEWWRF